MAFPATASARMPRRPDPAPRTRLRLTRRGRAVFTGLAAAPLAALAFVWMIASGGAIAEVPGGAPEVRYVTVEPGASLWAIAETAAPDADPRVVVDEIVRLNGLDDVVLQAGQLLALPLGL
nr:LysM peptidoglycan-binding domain-containing protein [Agromyces archimandritae]